MMSSLYIGATGIKSHGEGMAVITNNLANVNTVAFKQQSMQYSDLVSQYVSADSNLLTNISQCGAGARPNSIRTLFIQGGLEKGNEATDISIEGSGFFGVTRNNQIHYTRAGNFRFTEKGELFDPNGWTLLGHAITDGVESPKIVPIVLDLGENGKNGQMAAQATTSLTSCSQLGGLENLNDNPANPFFSMAAAWNGLASPPLADSRYSYHEPFQFYDSNGELRNGSIYYDLAGKSGGVSAVEYIVAFDPALDASSRANTASAGLLMAGTISFSSAGEISALTAFLPPESGSPADLDSWSTASLSDGYPVFAVHPTDAKPQDISLNMGLALFGDASGGLASPDDAASDPAVFYAVDGTATRNPLSSIFYGSSCSSIMSKKDGHAEGKLRSVAIDKDGTISGSYTNGEQLELFRISLYRFTSQDGLQNEGNNHYSATPEAGEIEEGVPGTENFGSVAQYSLEGSNVDYAREFSLMIITQRGFQMNSKVVTTSDEMLRKALELKR